MKVENKKLLTEILIRIHDDKLNYLMEMEEEDFKEGTNAKQLLKELNSIRDFMHDKPLTIKQVKKDRKYYTNDNS